MRTLRTRWPRAEDRRRQHVPNVEDASGAHDKQRNQQSYSGGEGAHPTDKTHARMYSCATGCGAVTKIPDKPGRRPTEGWPNMRCIARVNVARIGMFRSFDCGRTLNKWRCMEQGMLGQKLVVRSPAQVNVPQVFCLSSPQQQGRERSTQETLGQRALSQQKTTTNRDEIP